MIGTNGTGKTHVLKSLYAICENKKDRKFLEPYFSVLEEELIRGNGTRKSTVAVSFSESEMVYTIEGNLSELTFKSDDPIIRSLYIPAKEMLSHSKGFLALNNKYSIPFDQTYADIITNAELPESREVSELDQSLLNVISEVIDGKVIHENGSFYIVKMNGQKIEFPVEAEGFRKFGLLWKLIRNGLLKKDTILFWDEPEANINPELLPVLVDLLLALQKNGVQIFIATHSYNLAKYFEVKRHEPDSVIFHHLHKTENGVKVDSDTFFGELENNPIIEADAKLLDEVIERNFDE